MKILLASSEVHPYSKTGGLADMVGALGKALARAGHEVRIVTPLYRGIREKFPQIKREDWQFDLPLGARRVQAELYSLKVEKGLTVYFIQQPDFYFRAGLYLEDDISYADNDERFVFFSKCVAHLARYLPWRPDVVHVNDWQTGLVPALMLQQHAPKGGGIRRRSACPSTIWRIKVFFRPDAFASDEFAAGIISPWTARNFTAN